MSAASENSRRLIVLGCTGSIGVNTLKVVEHLNGEAASEKREVESAKPATGRATSDKRRHIEIVGLAAGKNVELLMEQARATGARAVALAQADEAALEKLRRGLPNVRIFAGADAALRLVEETAATDLVAAMVGSAGLPATLAGISRGMNIHLANKETLVAAGALVTPLVRARGVALLPVDSEHSAIFQCLAGQPRGAVKRIVLTASGGPFRTTDLATMRAATPEQALKHPTWNMGRKITIDSATMMNKALEIIEAHWLFDLPGEKIAVIIHPQSMVHSFVEFADHSVLAQLGPPDMKLPIQYALTWPERVCGAGQEMEWGKLSKLDFFPPDFERFPALKLAYEVIEAGGTAGAILNAANEAAVAAFLEGRIRFGRIVDLAAEALGAVALGPAESLEVILEADREARRFVEERIN